MAKKILIVDTSEWTGCNGCPCHFESGFHKQYCMAARKRLVWRDRIQEYCPLKELPEPEINNYITDEDWECLPDDYDVSTAYALGHQNGWNECLDAIEGTED